jgi:large subunit ribosomal protein L4
MAMRVALSVKVKEQRFNIMSSMDWDSGKTKILARRLQALGLRKTLFVTGESDVPTLLDRAMRNIEKVTVTTSDKLTVYDLMKWDKLVVDLKAVDFFERTLRKNVPFAPLTDK